MDWISFIDGESFAVPSMYGGMNSAERNKEGKKKSVLLKPQNIPKNRRNANYRLNPADFSVIPGS